MHRFHDFSSSPFDPVGDEAIGRVPVPGGQGGLFQTFAGIEPRTCGVLLNAGPSARLISAGDIGALYALASQNSRSTACGKVTVLDSEGIEVFQTNPFGTAEPAWCGNATAAAAVWIGRGTVIFAMRGPGGRPCRVEAIVSGSRASGRTRSRARVSQAWVIGDVAVTQSTWRGRRVVLLDPLNSYAVIQGPLPPGVTPEEARRELAGEALAAKLAVVTRCIDGADVTFFNAAGTHGAAPLTGLATLAIAAARCSWVKDLIEGDRVTYRGPSGRCFDILPKVIAAGLGQLRVALPTVEVELNRLPTAVPATPHTLERAQ